MNSEPGRVRAPSARTRLLQLVVATALVGVVLTAGLRAVRLAGENATSPDHRATGRTSAADSLATQTRPSEQAAPSKQTSPSKRAAPSKREPQVTSPTTPPATSLVAHRERRLFVLSDSVINGAASAIPKSLPGWEVVVDGKASRLIGAGVDEIEARRDELGPVVLVQLGNNYLGDERAFAEQLERLWGLVGPDRWLILLHVYPIQENRAEVNGAIDAFAAAHPNVRVADWPAVQDANPGTAYADDLHLTMQGAEVMAGFIRDTVTRVADRSPPIRSGT